MVYRRFAVANADRAHDPHPENPFNPKLAKLAIVDHDQLGHGAGCHVNYVVIGASSQIASITFELFSVVSRYFAGIRDINPSHERLFCPALWLAIANDDTDVY